MRKLLIETAREVGELLLENFGNERMSRIFKKKYKTDYSIQMDKIAEKKIIESFRENGIKGTIISEEIGKVDLGEGDYRIFVDPLDGTINYSKGIPVFCTSIGVQKDNEMIYGVVYYPSKDELFFAEKGKGSFLNNKRIQVDKKTDLESSTFDIGFDLSKPDSKSKLVEKVKTSAIRIMWSAALSLCFTACGRKDGVVYDWSNPWDFAAETLIVKEAGGVTTDFNGKPWKENSRNLLAMNNVLHEKLLDKLRGYMK